MAFIILLHYDVIFIVKPCINKEISMFHSKVIMQLIIKTIHILTEM